YAVSTLAVLTLLCLGFWFSARIGAAQGQLAAERAERERFEAAAEHSRKLASVSDYHRLLNQVRERNQQAPAGWTLGGLVDLRRAVPLLPGPGYTSELRSVAAACLGGVTLRELRRLGVGSVPAVLAFHPDGRTLAVGEIRALGWGSCRVHLYDVASG